MGPRTDFATIQRVSLSVNTLCERLTAIVLLCAFEVVLLSAAMPWKTRLDRFATAEAVARYVSAPTPTNHKTLLQEKSNQLTDERVIRVVSLFLSAANAFAIMRVCAKASCRVAVAAP